ncbi:MAG: hypothetical protein Q6373_002330 [Candidatus Sigynarchaeota archaeon]
MEGIPRRIETVYLNKLVWNGVYNEIHCKYKHFLWRKRLVSSTHVGVWGWNSWCGIHAFPLLTGGDLASIYKATVDVGFTRPEPTTGLLPHAVIHKDGVFGSQPEYKCYGGQHGESYNLDNMLCWAKMAMEYFLVTNDKVWFTTAKLERITCTVDYILDNLRGRFNPVLVEAGIEGDWTECTDWTLDNANVNVNFIETLRLLAECMVLIGKDVGVKEYQTAREAMIAAFNAPVRKGGFWDPELGHYVHGNDGAGDIVHGNKYFESTTNYFAILWRIAPPEMRKRIWEYTNAHRRPLEMPFPVLTNLGPRTGARRKEYRRTVTNGDVWMVLGAHAAAARLQDGYIKEGTEMYKAIVDYEAREGVLHNCLYPGNNTVNDSWDPEIANYGALFAPLVFGVLGIVPGAKGLDFNVAGLDSLEKLDMTFFFDGREHLLRARWKGNSLASISVQVDGSTIGETSNPRFLLARGTPERIVNVP